MTELFLWIIATITLTIWQIVYAIKILGVRQKEKNRTEQAKRAAKATKNARANATKIDVCLFII